MNFLISVSILLYLIVPTNPQLVILPGPEIQDGFKDNPKWLEFLLLQAETTERLETLVENVWTLIDIASLQQVFNPSLNFSLIDAFVTFHVPAFLEFFANINEIIQYGNPFPIFSTAVARHERSTLIHLVDTGQPLNPTQLSQLTWLTLADAAMKILSKFNLLSSMMLKRDFGGLNYAINDRVELWGGQVLNGITTTVTGLNGTYNLVEISGLIDTLFRRHERDHVMRTLLTLISNMRQPALDTIKSDLNHFCYGNNDFGVIPDIFDVIADTARVLVQADMQVLTEQVYQHVLQTILSAPRDKEVVKRERKAMWSQMSSRIEAKLKLPLLDGAGWPFPAGPIVFKCDLPPNNVLGQRGQWGRNVTTGMKPLASPSVQYDFPNGPMTLDGNPGYLDDRTPDVVSVGFQHTFKAYIESEIALDPTASCGSTCPEFHQPTLVCPNATPHCDLFRRSHCTLAGCMGSGGCRIAANCQRTGQEVRMCQAIGPTKGYDWVSFNGTLLSRGEAHAPEPPCQAGSTKAHERWEMTNGVILNTPQYCELCLCTCMTPFDPKAQEYFDISPLTSEVNKGLIVSAVRFVQTGNIIRLAIEQGKPSVRGVFDEMSLTWVEKPFGATEHLVKLGLDGFIRMNFHLISGSAGTVVTGLRFRHNPSDKSLSLEIQSTPITWPESDPGAITLTSSASSWISASSERPRDPVRLQDPDNPHRQQGPSMPNSVLNTYIDFRVSSYERDLGQTIVPLFDAQPVHYYERRRWLRGIGIMYKGKSGSGGFICPAIVPATPYKFIHYSPAPPKKISNYNPSFL